MQDKKNEIDNLNKQIQTSLSELSGKKSEAEELASEDKEERSKFDSQYLSQLERQLVKSQFDVIANSNSLVDDIQAAINLFYVLII